MDMTFLRDQYAGKRVLITGHSGFKGTWLTKILLEVGAQVIGFSKDEYKLDELQQKDNFKSVTADIRDAQAISDVISSYAPEAVFHLAAQSLVYQSYQDPADTFSTNVQGSLHVLDAIRNASSVKALVFVTSDKCYENNEWVWGYREEDALGGKDPYSASKACAEILFRSYWTSYFENDSNLLCCSVRAGNVIGGGDWSPNRIVPDAVQSLFNGETLYLRNPTATRPWQHVLEPLSGYLLLGAKLLQGDRNACGSWNFGPAQEEIRSVGDVASALHDLINKGTVEVNIKPDQLHEAGLLKLNCDKATSLLNWKPRWRFDTTIEKTVEWYRCYYQKEDTTVIYRKQINEYFNNAEH